MPISVSARSLVLLVLLVLVLLVLVLLGGCGGSSNPDRVTLQLNWLHEAEFVGYYMAESEGFYRAERLDVEILGGGPGSPAREKVVDGAAEFAITSFAEQRNMTLDGVPVTAIMAVFQIPPLVIFALNDSGISEPAHLAGKRVGVTTDYWRNVLHQTLTAAGVDPTAVAEVKVGVGELSRLYNREVDAWLGYAQDEPIQAETAGHPVLTIFPADYGVGGYEGLVIASDVTLREKPDMVRRFIRASHKGWQYALEHPDEAAEVLATWAPEHSVDFHRLAVRAVVPLVDTPQAPVGWIDAERWRRLMGDSFEPARPGYTMEFVPTTP